MLSGRFAVWRLALFFLLALSTARAESYRIVTIDGVKYLVPNTEDKGSATYENRGTSHTTTNNRGTSYSTSNNYGTSFSTQNNYGRSYGTINNYGESNLTINQYAPGTVTVNKLYKTPEKETGSGRSFAIEGAELKKVGCNRYSLTLRGRRPEGEVDSLKREDAGTYSVWYDETQARKNARIVPFTQSFEVVPEDGAVTVITRARTFRVEVNR